MLLGLCILSSGALKISDPSNLRVGSNENISLQSWCAGVGCVMPFTPASCLSWCDWNVDKQEDAAARGAFQNKRWGDAQVLATKFSITIADVTGGGDCETDAAKKSVYNFVDDKGEIGFPGGDKETKFKETQLNCGQCYQLKTKAPAGTRVAHLWITFSKAAATTTKMNVYADKACAGAKDKTGYPFLERKKGITKVKGETDAQYETCTAITAGTGGGKLGLSMAGVVPPTKCAK